MAIYIGISGKRYIKLTEHEKVKEEIIQHITNVLNQHKTKEFIGLSSIAEGADSIFANIVLTKFHQPLQIVLPFAQKEYEKDFSPPHLEQFKKFINLAKTVEVISEKTPITKEERTNLYFAAGQYIVDHSTAMIFITDDSEPLGKGGTADVISYFCEEKKETDSFTIIVESEDKDDLYRQINDLYDKSNINAIIARDKHRSTWKASLLMGWLAVTLFAIKIGYPVEDIMDWILSAAEFGLIITTIIIIIIANKKKYHGEYLKQRARTEQLRLLKIYYLTKKQVLVPFITSCDDNDLKNIIIAVNQSASNSISISKWFASFQIREMVLKQIDYYKSKINEIGSRPKRYEIFKLLVGILFVTNLSFQFLQETFHQFWFVPENKRLIELGKFLTIALPALYASIEGILYFEDWQNIQKRAILSKEALEKVLKRLPQKLMTIDDDVCNNIHQRILNISSTIMLDDNRKWHTALEDKANYHWV